MTGQLMVNLHSYTKNLNIFAKYFQCFWNKNHPTKDDNVIADKEFCPNLGLLIENKLVQSC